MICNLPSISILHSTVEISDLDISPFDFYSLLFLREMNILSKIHLQSTVTHCFLLIVKLKSGGFMHSGSLFHFLHHCTIGDCRRFISNSHTSNDQFYDTWRMTHADKVIQYILGPIRQTSGSRLIRKSGFDSWIYFGLAISDCCCN